MKRSISILTGVLVVQALLVMFFYLRSNEGNFKDKGVVLLSEELKVIDRIVISNLDKKTVELRKNKGSWTLPEALNFPVSAEKIKTSVGKLYEIKDAWPVGRTKISAKQFEVVEGKFERKIELFTGEKLVNTVYLGTSPSYKKVHFRVNQSDETYSINFSTYDLPVDYDSWYNRDLYKLDRSKLERVELSSVTLTKKEGNFVVKDLKEGETTNSTEVAVLMNRLANPRFEKVLSSGESFDKTGDKYLSYSLVNKDGQRRGFTYFSLLGSKDKKPKEATKDETVDESLVLKVSDIPYFFKISKTRVEEILKTNKDTLVKIDDAKNKSLSDKDENNHDSKKTKASASDTKKSPKG